MLKTFASVLLVFALFCTLGVRAAFARGSSEPETKAAETASQPVGPSKSEVAPTEKPNQKLRADMIKLVRDAKAGKVVPAARPQIQPAQSNSLSKGAKVAIGVGIAVAVIAVIVIVAARNTPGRVL
jgi:TRAP-type uncharacterized transport system fused permease subunit